MSTKTLYRLGGVSLLVALPLQILGFVLHHPGTERVEDVLSPLYTPAHLVLFVSWLLALFGLPAFYARQANRAGILGLLGYALTLFAAAYHFYLLLYEAYATKLMAQLPATQLLIGMDGPLAHGANALGPLSFALVLAFPLFGIATVRARIFPRAVGWLQILSVPVFFLGMFIVSPDLPNPIPIPGLTPIAVMYYLLFGGYALAGYTLWAVKEPSREPFAQTEAAQPV